MTTPCWRANAMLLAAGAAMLLFSPAASGQTTRAIGPYSPIVAAGDLRLLSGQVAIDPRTGRLDTTLSIEDQTRLVWDNIRSVLDGAGLKLSDVVQAQVFLTDMGDYAEMNSAYAAALGSHRPARTTVQVVALPLGAKIEIAVVAFAPGVR
jgi:2-iminobutanoate/2-iminopropanoate deaminase